VCVCKKDVAETDVVFSSARLFERRPRRSLLIHAVSRRRSRAACPYEVYSARVTRAISAMVVPEENERRQFRFYSFINESIFVFRIVFRFEI